MIAVAIGLASLAVHEGKMQTSTKWLIVLGAAAVGALISAGIYEETKPAGPTTILTRGHRYAIVFTCPVAIPQPTISAPFSLVSASSGNAGGIWTMIVDYAGPTGSYPVAQQGCSVAVTDQGPSPAVPTMIALVQGRRYKAVLSCPGLPLPPPTSSFLGVGPISIVSIEPSPPPPLSTTWSVLFDFTGPGVSVPTLVPGNGTMCSLDIQDEGQTPIGGAQPAIQIPFVAGQPQAVHATSPGGRYSGRALPGGSLQIATTSPIAAVDNDPAIQSALIGPSNEAQVVLTGAAGKIVVHWGGGVTTVVVHPLNINTLVNV